MADGLYHPQKSRASEQAISDFLLAKTTGDLLEVPGISPESAEALKRNGVSTTFGLFGKYLMLKEEKVDPIEHAHSFYYWLRSVGTVVGNRASIVHAVSSKMNLTFPGIYDPDAYDYN